MNKIIIFESCIISVIVAYEEMTGENEQTGKQQVVVHLTLREYKVCQIIKQKNLKGKRENQIISL